MTSAAYPTVHAALVTLATATLPSVRVVDGYDVSEDPGNIVQIGVPSLSSTTSISAGTFTQEMETFGRLVGGRLETGSINGVAMAWNGDGDQAAARSAAFGYIAAIGDALRTDPSMGVTAFAELVAELSTGDVAEDKVDGATTAISFTVAYKARI
jgi:hypothetical protein